MKVSITGFKHLIGTSKKSGKDFAGFICFYVYQDRDTIGSVSDSAFIPDQIMAPVLQKTSGKLDMLVNKTAVINFNRKGFVDSLDV